MAFPVSLTPAHIAPVTIQHVNYHGWSDALRLSNGLVEAIVVPQIGRVMRFQFVGQPQTDPLYEDPYWAGKTGADTDLESWANFGGDKLWPSPQSTWPGGFWPPDKAFDGDPFYVQAIPNGVRLISPGSLPFAARAFRSITMRPGQTRLYFDQKLVKDAHAPKPFPIGVWTITQVRGDGTVSIPTIPIASQPNGFLSLSDVGVTEAAPYYQLTDQTLRIVRDPVKSHKISAWPSTGVISFHYGSGLTFSEHFTPPAPGASYAPNEQPTEVYAAGGKPGYFELEILGPLSSLNPGESAALSVYWQLYRTPHR
ncbi:MAG: hypothetical protein ACRYFS_24285 [Janthinobacterium lividum]